MTVEEWLDWDKLRIDIWTKKYQRNEESFDEWLDRVSGGDVKVRKLIEEKKFLFGGRILAGRGDTSEEKATYSNCYVIAPPEDNIESIYGETCSKLARTFSYGGGCGIDISKLAPNGAKVRNQAKTTSGAVSFMPTFALVPKQIGQNGRRGALMISMDVAHPDIMEFIDAKKNTDEITSANISVRVSNKFMEAVEDDSDWTLSFYRKETGEQIKRTVRARDIFQKICENNWNYAEPGILFWDKIKDWNMLSSDPDFEFAGVNPCAEEPLPAGGSCLLGSLNLAAFVDEDGSFSYVDFTDAVRTAVVALNDVLDEGLEKHPLEEQKRCVSEWRQIGLGIMGYADALIKMKIRYGSDEAINFAHRAGAIMAINALHKSHLLGKERGPYKKYNEAIAKSGFYTMHHGDKEIDIYTPRNSQLLTIAPTGSTSTMLGVSGGIEPIFARTYTRKTESLHGKEILYEVITPIFKEYMETNGINNFEDLPSYFVTSADIPYEERIETQAMWQQHIDASISSTINLPESATVEDIWSIYMLAWRRGLKGVTIYRQSCERAGVLVDNEEKQEEKNTNTSTEIKSNIVFDSIIPVSRKSLGTTHGDTFCRRCACGTMYITVNRDNEGHIVECFIETSKGGICKAHTAGLNRMASLALRSGVKVDEIIDQLEGIDCPACTKVSAKGTALDGISCPDILAKTIREFKENGLIKSYDALEPKVTIDANNTVAKVNSVRRCPECGNPIFNDGGCVRCSCGWSGCEN